MKVCWKVEGHNGLFKLTPPWRAEDDTKEADVVMVVASNEQENAVNVANANTGEVLLANIPVEGMDFDRVLTEAGWPIAGTADMLYDARGVRFIYNVPV